MAESSEVVVIGAGAAGCAAAFYLAGAGVRTTVVERQGVASYASGYSAGGLNPLQGAQIPGPLAPMAQASFEMHLGLWERLEEASGVDFHARRTGAVNVAFDEEDFAPLTETKALFDAADGFTAEYVDADDMLREEPRLSGDALGGLRLFGNAVLDSALLHPGAAPRRRVARRDDALRRRHRAGDARRHGRGRGAGRWADRVRRGGSRHRPLERRRPGLAGRAHPGGAAEGRDSADEAAGRAARPRLVRCGRVAEREGGRTRVGRRNRAERGLGRRAQRVGATDAVRRGRAADALLRRCRARTPHRLPAAVTPDWLPILGRAPGWANAYLATGAGKKGILLAPAMGRAVADLVTGSEPSLDLSPFAPERFA